MKQKIKIFDHPFVPALIIIGWAVGFIMGLFFYDLFMV